MIGITLTNFAAACSVKGGGFFGFPKWYKYLETSQDSQGRCIPSVTKLNDVWLIVAAGIEILLRVAAIVAVAFVVYAGIQYVTSQGSPEKVNQAKNTLINAVAGLAIAVLAAVIVSFIAKRIAGA
jgi:ABC-type Fe3+ transport system permease subunit